MHKQNPIYQNIMAHNKLTFLTLLFCLLGSRFSHSQQITATTSQSISVSLTPRLTNAPLNGRVLVFFSKKSSPPPKNGPNWFSPEPFFGKNVEGMTAADNVVVDDSADGFPGKLSNIAAGRYFVQAVLDQDEYYSDHKNGPGNLFSNVQEIVITPGKPARVNLTLDKVIPKPVFDQTATAKVITYESRLLSEFHKRQVEDRALVLLPRSYAANPNRRYPVYYEITGFGATIGDLLKRHRQSTVATDGVEFIHVMLTGQCKWGHHVYANSATNGPRGAALVKELIPLIDSRFRTIPKSSARFVGGHSSGGWSSLWLQLQHPDVFDGVWSTAPDPVDFRDWQGTDLYASGANVLFGQNGANGTRKPLARRNGKTLIWYDDFLKMDDTLGRGGQLRSFEAVFSPVGEDGLPQKCWDRKTGAVIPAVAAAWRKYDIGIQLEENWPQWKNKLSGKIHVFMGTQDTFFLNKSTRLLADRLQQLGSDAEVEFFEGRDHFNLIDQKLRERIYQGMATAFKNNE